ncbi:hypothetical protein J518_4414, partial [Acinetobacter baumannii 1419130]
MPTILAISNFKRTNLVLTTQLRKKFNSFATTKK